MNLNRFQSHSSRRAVNASRQIWSSWLKITVAAVVGVAVVAAMAVEGPVNRAEADTDPWDPATCTVEPLPAPTPPTEPTSGQQAWTMIHKTVTLLSKGASLADGTLSDKLEAGGWFLDAFSGTKESDPDYEALRKQMDQQQDQLNQLQATLSYVCQITEQIQSQLEQLSSQVHWSTYLQKIVPIEAIAADINTENKSFAQVINIVNQQTPGTPITDGNATTDLNQIRQNSRDDLDKLNQWVQGSGNDSLAQLYSLVVEDSLKAQGRPVPSATHLYLPEFVHPMYNLMAWVTSLMVSDLQLLSESWHVNYVDGGTEHKADDTFVKSEVTDAQKYIAAWSNNAAPTGADIPDGTFVDARNPSGNTARMWSLAPVSIDDDDPADYCYRSADFCFDNNYTPDGQIASTKMITPQQASLPALAGYSDWQVPTQSQYDALAAGTTKGLDDQFATLGLDALKPRKITSHFGGKDSSISEIGPLLALNSDGDPGVEHWATPTSGTPANAFTFTKVTNPQNQLAGALFLTRDYVLSYTGAANSVAAAAAATPAPIGTPVDQRTPGSGALGDTVFYTDSSNSCQDTTYTVPAGAHFLAIQSSGGAGGSGWVTKDKTKATAVGGNGGEVSMLLPVRPGAVLHVQVGADGGNPGGGAGGGGRGGDAVGVNGYNDIYSGGGGGASGVSADCNQWLAVGAGGGGAGAGFATNSFGGYPATAGGRGGDACATVGSCSQPQAGSAKSNAQPPYWTGGGAGSTSPNNIGATGPIAAGSGGVMQGGNGSDGARTGALTGGGSGGGGGAGYYGGGGGGGGGLWATGGGGAGGTNFTIDTGTGLTPISAVTPDGAVSMVGITPQATLDSTPLTMTASSTSLGWGEPLTLTAHLPNNATGLVRFYELADGEEKSLGAPSAHNGTASVKPTLSIGDHQVFVCYDGDDAYPSVCADWTTISIVKKAPTITLTTSGFRLDSSADLTLTATISPAIDGSLAFYDSSLPGPDHGIGIADIVNGTATLLTPTKALPAGNNSLYAYYTGNDNLNEAFSNTIQVNFASGGDDSVDSNEPTAKPTTPHHPGAGTRPTASTTPHHPGAGTRPTAPTTPHHPRARQGTGTHGNGLAETGLPASSLWLAWAGIAFLAAGASLIFLRRRHSR